MRLSVDGAGYATAASAFADGNRLAALHHESLAGKLGGYAAMAGDDAGAAEFAAAYDHTSTEAVRALADLVGAFAGLGRLTEQSVTNHRAANARSVVAGAVVHDGTTLPEAGYVTVLPATPPTSLGGDSPSFPAEVAWVLDHVQGFTWPNADTDRLRDAAHVWRMASGDLDELAAYCDTASAGLEPRRSPEIPLALAAVDDLRASVRELAGQYVALAGSCEAYADQVDGKRKEIRAAVREILAMVVEGVAISGAIALLTAGGGALVGGGAIAARVAAQTPRLTALLASLRALTAATAARLRTTHAGIRATRARLDKFLGNPVRSEARQVHLSRRRSGWLRRHEANGGHAIKTHVGPSDEELLARYAREPNIKGSSAFPDEATAERAIGALLDETPGRIASWLAGDRRSLVLEGRMDFVVGRHAAPSGDVIDVQGVRVVMVRAPHLPEGFRLVTGYPVP